MWKYNILPECAHLKVGSIVMDRDVTKIVTELIPASLQSCSYNYASLVTTDKGTVGHPYWICNCKRCIYWTGTTYPFTTRKK